MSGSGLVVEPIGGRRGGKSGARLRAGEATEAYRVSGASELIGPIMAALAALPTQALADLARVISDETAARGETDRLIGLLAPRDGAALQRDRLAQVVANTELRSRFLAEHETLTSSQVAAQALSRSTNRAALAWQWRTKRRILGVPVRGEWRFPAFQFEPQGGRPRASIGEVLEVLGGALGEWGTALWFVAPNGWLGGARPIDRLDDRPALLAAARGAVERPDF